VLVEAFVAHPGVEALAVGVLDRLAGVDEMQANAVLVCPLLKHATEQFRTVVQHQLRRGFSLAEEPVQYAHDPASR
jgi:hypothetical protein